MQILTPRGQLPHPPACFDSARQRAYSSIYFRSELAEKAVLAEEEAAVRRRDPRSELQCQEVWR